MTFQVLITRILNTVINPLIYLLFGIALLVFLWGVVEMVAKADNEAARTKGRQHIIWGLVGLAIMFSVFGFVNIIQSVVCGDGGCPSSLRR